MSASDFRGPQDRQRQRSDSPAPGRPRRRPAGLGAHSQDAHRRSGAADRDEGPLARDRRGARSHGTPGEPRRFPRGRNRLRGVPQARGKAPRRRQCGGGGNLLRLPPRSSESSYRIREAQSPLRRREQHLRGAVGRNARPSPTATRRGRRKSSWCMEPPGSVRRRSTGGSPPSRRRSPWSSPLAACRPQHGSRIHRLHRPLSVMEFSRCDYRAVRKNHFNWKDARMNVHGRQARARRVAAARPSRVLCSRLLRVD